MQALLAGQTVVDTLHPSLVWEIPCYPAYYLPRADDAGPSGADRRHRALAQPGRRRRSTTCASASTSPRAPRWPTRSRHPECATSCASSGAAMDEWLEEDEPVYVHRAQPSTRGRHPGQAPPRPGLRGRGRAGRLVPTAHPLRDRAAAPLLPATGRPPHQPLVPSERTCQCPYKGTASYWSVQVGDALRRLRLDLPQPAPRERQDHGTGLLASEKVDLVIDGVPQERPRTLLLTLGSQPGCLRKCPASGHIDDILRSCHGGARVDEAVRPRSTISATCAGRRRAISARRGRLRSLPGHVGSLP